MANLGYIQLSRRCNQHCLFCSNPDNGLSLTLDEAKELVDDLARRRYFGVIFTGGEPTLFPALPQIVGYARQKHLHTRIITNAQLLSNGAFVKRLAASGLDHVNVSLHTHVEALHDRLTDTPLAFENAVKALHHFGKTPEITVNINIVINALNQHHLHKTVAWMVKTFPFVPHFVFNNLDPSTNRAEDNKHTIPSMKGMEVSLYKALRFLELSGKNFRVERVPLCYMADFAWASTETRKIIKSEQRFVHFLDAKGIVDQRDFMHEKVPLCSRCSYNNICAGLYELGSYYDPEELAPVFKDPAPIINRVLSEP